MDTDTEYSNFPTVSVDGWVSCPFTAASLHAHETVTLESQANVLPLTRDNKYLLQNDAKRELAKEIVLNTPSRLEGKTRILRASDVLLSLAGRPTTNGIHSLLQLGGRSMDVSYRLGGTIKLT